MGKQLFEIWWWMVKMSMNGTTNLTVAKLNSCWFQQFVFKQLSELTWFPTLTHRDSSLVEEQQVSWIKCPLADENWGLSKSWLLGQTRLVVGTQAILRTINYLSLCCGWHCLHQQYKRRWHNFACLHVMKWRWRFSKWPYREVNNRAILEFYPTAK